MAKPKGSKFKKRDKKKTPRGGGHGFTKTKLIKGFESYASIPRTTPKRSTMNRTINAEEEVHIVSSDGIFDDQPSIVPFSQLASTSIVTGTTASVSNLEVEDDLGFFFDSAPSTVLDIEEPVETNVSKPTSYQRKKQRVIQDESVYISSGEDDDDMMDDTISISSSEDIEILKSLSHWGTKDIMHANVPSIKTMDEDYALLAMTYFDEICYSEEESESEEDEDEVMAFDDVGLDLDSIENVPDSLKNSYKAMMRQEQMLFETQTKRYHKLNKVKKNGKKSKDHPPKDRGKSILDKIIHFLEGTEKSYRLDNLTNRGRTVIVPKLANMFELQVDNTDVNNIILTKIPETNIPKSLYAFREKAKNGGKSKKKVVHHKEKSKTRNTSRRERFEIRDNALHGQQVASSSTPISSDNVGHRMLAAMGWKEGSSIGNTGDGIKEPVKVFMRANRRGLGA